MLEHDCDVQFDESVLALLDRENAERDEVTAVLNGRPREAPHPKTRSGIDTSRFPFGKLKTFQRRDLAHLLSLSHGANFSVPGAGKTAVTYAAYESERLRGRVTRALVVAPLSAFDAWTSEADKWMRPAPVVRWLEDRIPAKCEVLLVNYQRLSGRYDRIVEWITAQPTHVILDEAHRIKSGKNGEWGAACLGLALHAARRDILTGTPAPQHPKDFLALLEFLWPNQSSRILPSAAAAPHPSPDVMEQVSRRLRPFFVRTKKGELRLRPPKLQVELVEMKPLQAEIYETMRRRIRQTVSMTSRDRLLFSQLADVVVYLMEAATNPALLGPALGGIERSRTVWPPSPIPEGSSLIDRVVNYTKYEMPRKFEKLATIVGKNAKLGRKTLVWSNFVTNLEDLANRVLAPYKPAMIYGAIPSTQAETAYRTRQTELWRFRRDPECMVLLANPAAMSEGVSLHEECHDAIYLDRTFNAGQYLQSLDRIHRLGLAKGVDTRITFLVTTGTIDETIDRRVRLKAERLSQMLSDPDLLVMAMPDIGDYGEWVDTDDLDGLFAHLSIDE